MADLPQSDRTPSTSCCSGTSDLLSRAPRRSASLCTPTAGGIRKSPMCDADGHTRSSPTPDRKIGNLGTGFQTSDFSGLSRAGMTPRSIGAGSGCDSCHWLWAASRASGGQFRPTQGDDCALRVGVCSPRRGLCALALQAIVLSRAYGAVFKYRVFDCPSTPSNPRFR